MDEGQACVDTGLTLGLSLGIGGGGGGECRSSPSSGGTKRKNPFATAPVVKFHALFPSLHLKQEDEEDQGSRGADHDFVYRDDGSSSTRTSFGDATAKRHDHHDKEESADDGATNREGASGSSSAGRKKLRLSKEQSKMLEDSFRQHPTLNPTQKLELAEKLSLLPRQVEVWFQNRRARTKLKQTEVDLEFLRRFCAALRDENARLKEELHELRSAMVTSNNPEGPSPTYNAARPRKKAAASCASCMTAVETPTASCCGGNRGGDSAAAAAAAARPIGFYRYSAPSKRAR